MTVTLTPRGSHRAARQTGYAADAITMPIPVPTSIPAPRHQPTIVASTPGGRRVQAPAPAGRPRGLVTAAVVLGIVALAAVALSAYLLGVRSTSTSVAPAAATSPSAAPTQTFTPGAAAVPAVAVSGPQLVDTSGRALDAATAEQVHDVYDALQAGDITALHTAYAAAGSDQGLDIESHLHNAATRGHLLEALRSHPTHPGSGYTYRLNGYTLSFNQAGALGAGLGSITGPWGEQSDTTTKSSSPTSSTRAAAHATAKTRAPSRGAYGPDRPVIEADRSSSPDCQGIALDDLPGACICGGGTGGLNDLCP